MYMSNFFKSRHPIVAVAMNKVSDVNLAIVCAQAGIVPSITGFNFYQNNKLVPQLLNNALTEFFKNVQDSDVILSLHANDICNAETFEILKNHNIKYVEVVEAVPANIFLEVKNWYKEIGISLIIKILSSARDLSDYDIVLIKGPDGAGRFDKNETSLEDMFLKIKKNYPAIKTIVSGGIGSSDQVKKLLDLGANCVGIGTLLAVSKESRVSYETKLKIVNSTSNDLTELTAKEATSISLQHVLKFSDYNGIDDGNNTKSLKQGIASPTSGHIFVGTAIDKIDQILPVCEIVDNLMKF